MKRFFFLVLIFQNAFSQEIPLNVQKLIKAYPDQIIGYKDNKIIFSDKSSLIYDDFKNKTNQELLDNPDIEDHFKFIYHKAEKNLIPKEDPGRIRNEVFFKKIYGNSKSEVESKMTEIVWCPKLVNQKIKVTTVNGIDKIVKKISAELDNKPEFKKYITDIGGTFSWRKISGTNRLSMHSYGMTIDINVKNSNYWQWDCKCKNEEATLTYRNQIPLKLVSIFEKYGFIWGGNWKHYDTMHFEYRPELLL
ncbi:M15 family metallopeptidase [Flavobacterium phragmitis]|uniref:D-alanyl-D-alanine carboxypeptidase n=1 Tax=Flavobacterium phragmitis TaxID=739143 RepID=A0A1I1WAB7_9FLAO|nr:M15 family metallopeptidase [Flavobacterium phragmitis]SFD89980.1 D-alanyl-D-alanine carboxypeptidase [Flavobacterium phragmitis]